MSIPAVLTAFVHWLRSGYPDDAPRYGHSPLLALMDQRLSPEQLSEIVIALDGKPVSEAIDIQVAITAATGRMPSPADLSTVCTAIEKSASIEGVSTCCRIRGVPHVAN
ncbi:hypothetical protein BS297_30460 [Rhodococcus erythropolis]|uniref:DUF3349 domain-containing protein n=1 Tax=Rhodococcus erythropolis TaxID=1833 RepID=A0A5N5DU66_RHOER|nr:DUF3349 domain-containing protein [Rhodococcus sp. MEB032]KAB2581525.1 hypothetical protein BS297_30460 [Rhodococcus erythropolis]MCY4666716.1 DUF3349 domain-containing protein [Rhodococcus sp. (in: high G+C Gram-positive bacteria)]